MAQDGDSFNAAHCLANGLGTSRDEPAAVALYESAAVGFGHFDSITKWPLGTCSAACLSSSRSSMSSMSSSSSTSGTGPEMCTRRCGSARSARRRLGRSGPSASTFPDVGKAKRSLGIDATGTLQLLAVSQSSALSVTGRPRRRGSTVHGPLLYAEASQWL